MSQVSRRRFVSIAAGVVAAAPSLARGAAGANDKVTLALVGANGRGSYLAKHFNRIDGVEFAYVCDPDQRSIGKGLRSATAGRGKKPQTMADFRKALEDPNLDGVVIATPNHWHAPATLMALDAGKHVYVEKPCSHNPDEGERMISAAAAATGRVVQVGTQRRSSPLYQEVVEKVQSGAIGEVLFAKSWYHSVRPSIGRKKPTAPPAELDFNLWQGPVTSQPYQENLLPYNWHFFWHWGNGELGNNGIHTIDITRWTMGVDYPKQVTASASKLRYEDDQQTPDTYNVTYDFGDRVMVWEGVAWSGRYLTGSSIGIELRGEKGIIFVDDSGYKLMDEDRKVVEEGTGARGDKEHFEGFINCIRNGSAPAANITEAHKSTLYCHLGNMAHRAGSRLEVDPSNGRVLNNPAASKLWSREYRPGWLA